MDGNTASNDRFVLHNADCLEAMKGMAADSVDAIVTDPPYGLAFMGSKWDNFGGKSCGNDSAEVRRQKAEEYAAKNSGAPRYANGHGGAPTLDAMRSFQSAMTPIFAEALRVAKPGAHLLAFGGTRTYHRLACAIEDAGWEIRDCIMWVYGSGFPKSMDVSKAIDKMMGVERKSRNGEGDHEGNIDFGMKNRCPKCGKPYFSGNPCTCPREDSIPVTPEAAAWQGFGTQLKPAYEPIVIARKPLEGTVAANVLKYGTGAINIDGCRVPTEGESVSNHSRSAEAAISKGKYGDGTAQETHQTEGQKLGRFPANLIHDGSEEVLALFPDSKGQCGAVKGTEPSRTGTNGIYGNYNGQNTMLPRGDTGSAARFFYCAKASRSERNKNCERLLQWEQDQELTQLIEKSSQLLRAISESMMQTLDALVCNMTSFGNDTTVQSQSECKFIMSTALKLITELKTSLSSQPSNTSDAILDAIKTSEESGINVAQLAEKLKHLKIVSTSAETDIAINAVSALFDVLSEIRGRAKQGNHHCTIKPLALMRYLVRLVTRKGGIVLDPFMGSGTTGVAAIQEGMNFIGVEREPHYYEIAQRRISQANTIEHKPEEKQMELPL